MGEVGKRKAVFVWPVGEKLVVLQTVKQVHDDSLKLWQEAWV